MYASGIHYEASNKSRKCLLGRTYWSGLSSANTPLMYLLLNTFKAIPQPHHWRDSRANNRDEQNRSLFHSLWTWTLQSTKLSCLSFGRGWQLYFTHKKDRLAIDSFSTFLRFKINSFLHTKDKRQRMDGWISRIGAKSVADSNKNKQVLNTTIQNLNQI